MAVQALVPRGRSATGVVGQSVAGAGARASGENGASVRMTPIDLVVAYGVVNGL